MAINMSKKIDDSLKQLKILLPQTKDDICKKWNDIQLNNKEISYKKANIDKKFEYFTAKVALAQSSDKSLSEWVRGYEKYKFSSLEAKKAFRAAFTKKEAEDFDELSASITRTRTDDGGYSFIFHHDDAHEGVDKSIRYKAYQDKLEKVQCDFWKTPYELLSEHCGTDSHVEL